MIEEYGNAIQRFIDAIAFNCSAYPASNSSAHIYLPSNTTLLDSSSSIDIGSLAAGKNVTVSWNIHVDPKAVGSNITVSAGGRVSGFGTPGILERKSGFIPGL